MVEEHKSRLRMLCCRHHDVRLVPKIGARLGCLDESNRFDQKCWQNNSMYRCKLMRWSLPMWTHGLCRIKKEQEEAAERECGEDVPSVQLGITNPAPVRKFLSPVGKTSITSAFLRLLLSASWSLLFPPDKLYPRNCNSLMFFTSCLSFLPFRNNATTRRNHVNQHQHLVLCFSLRKRPVVGRALLVLEPSINTPPVLSWRTKRHRSSPQT